MTRREFLPSASVLTVAASAFGFSTKNAMNQNFSMHYAPHFGMFKHSAGEDLMDQLNFAADQGFTAWEDNGMKGRSTQTQERIADTMAKRNMQMGVFVAHTIFWNEPSLASGDDQHREQFLKEIEESVEVAKRVNATWMTVVPGFVDLRADMEYQTAHVIESLRRASDILEPHGLVMAIEPLNPVNHPGLFLSEIPHAYQICRSVNSPACKILNDLYHQQITEGNLIPNIDASWDEIVYFQIGDNPGRKEPTTGEINFTNVFSHIREKGFKGILGMEHGNMHPGAEGEQALIEAYRTVDGHKG
ncbi:MAG: TIM barrel protein [Bacteroidetes bacterium]|nr:TIM barrel protein [Bacteroidota bacterium]